MYLCLYLSCVSSDRFRNLSEDTLLHFAPSGSVLPLCIFNVYLYWKIHISQSPCILVDLILDRPYGQRYVVQIETISGLHYKADPYFDSSKSDTYTARFVRRRGERRDDWTSNRGGVSRITEKGGKPIRRKEKNHLDQFGNLLRMDF